MDTEVTKDCLWNAGWVRRGGAVVVKRRRDHWIIVGSEDFFGSAALEGDSRDLGERVAWGLYQGRVAMICYDKV